MRIVQIMLKLQLYYLFEGTALIEGMLIIAKIRRQSLILILTTRKIVGQNTLINLNPGKQHIS